MFVLSEEQELIRSSVSRYVAEQFSFHTRQRILKSESGYDPDQWRQFAELGWLGMAIPEEYGGYGGNILDIALVCQEFARALLVSPYLTTVGVARAALVLSASHSQKTRYLGQIAEGRAIISCALNEHEDPSFTIQTEARRSGNDYLLNGCKRLVPFGDQADHLIASALLDGEVALFIVPSRSAGVTKRPYKMYDGWRAADIDFSRVTLSRDQVLPGTTEEKIACIQDIETALMCTETSAMMWEIHHQTLDYMKQREQFGQTLSQMPALQHRIVDLYVQCQLAQSMAENAVLAVNGSMPAAERMREVSAAKAHIAEQGRLVGKEGIQLHGGMGMTDEVAVGHYLKRITSMAQMNGDVNWHRYRYHRLDPFQPNDPRPDGNPEHETQGPPGRVP